jgi:serine protease inhibitor
MHRKVRASGIRRAAVLLTVLLMTLVVVCGCGGKSQTPTTTSTKSTPTPSEADMKEFYGQLNAMALNFHKQVTSEDPNANVFVSPTSLEMALAMTENGAAGETLTAMKKTLGLSGFENSRVNASNKAFIDSLSKLDKTIELNIANSLWLTNTLKFSDKFLADNRVFYNAEVSELNFSDPGAADTINSWASQKTKGKITNVIAPPINPATNIVLANATYFKGTWLYPFDKTKTADGQFKLMDGTTKTVPMMSLLCSNGYLENADFQMVVLQYGKMNSGGNRVSMFVFLPKDPKGIYKFVDSLNMTNWKSWTSTYGTAIVDLKMPRFKLDYNKALNTSLTSMGMGIAFGNKADFSPMTAGNGKKVPFISGVQQKTYVDVNEEGTEAAAVTTIAEGEGPPPDRTTHAMVVDHPFFFAICDDASGAILFTGTVLAP